MIVRNVQLDSEFLLRVCPLLQDAAKSNSRDSYAKFTEAAWTNNKECTLRGQLDFHYQDTPIDISEVEEAKEIVKRFCTGEDNMERTDGGWGCKCNGIGVWMDFVDWLAWHHCLE